MKRITVKCAEWGDPYPCGYVNTVKIGKETIGSFVDGNIDETMDVIKTAYKKGVEDGRQERQA